MLGIAAFHPQIVHFVIALIVVGVGFRWLSLAVKQARGPCGAAASAGTCGRVGFGIRRSGSGGCPLPRRRRGWRTRLFLRGRRGHPFWRPCRREPFAHRGGASSSGAGSSNWQVVRGGGADGAGRRTIPRAARASARTGRFSPRRSEGAPGRVGPPRQPSSPHRRYRFSGP